jgi:hypothetical protein
MLRHNQKLRRIELAHPDFSERSDVERLKNVLKNEMHRTGSTRAVLRAVTTDPMEDEFFRIEAKIPFGGGGTLCFFGFNTLSRRSSELIVQHETTYLAKVLVSKRRAVRDDLEIARLEAAPKILRELEELLSRTYSDYPIPLDAASIGLYMNDALPFAVLEEGRIVSALFGIPSFYCGRAVVEFTLSATSPSARGVGMTTALAARIKAEAEKKYGNPVMLAETIASPVMHSCHDLGMQCCGLLREHYKISVADRTYTNLYAWWL